MDPENSRGVMKKKNWKHFILVLFYVNLVIYVGGEVYWDIASPKNVASMTNLTPSDSGYGHFISKYSQQYGQDWRLISSIIQAESSFRPDVTSNMGAVGLMQVLPWVAQADGVTNIKDPEENVKFGVKHYTRYFNVLKGETLEDTQKINLAAYNAGIGHIRDARQLARYLGLNPRKWSSLEKALPLLEQEEFRPFLKHGYCQGNSVITYVQKVFRTYDKYREKHPDYPVQLTEEL